MKRNNIETFAADPQSERHGWTGEQKLARAVIVNGLREAARGAQPAHKADALAWLISESTDACSFLWWLSFLTDHPESLADYIRRKVDLTGEKSEEAPYNKQLGRPKTEEHRQAISESIHRNWSERKQRAKEEQLAKLAALLNARKSTTT